MEEILKIVAVVLATTLGFTIGGVAGFGGGVVALPVLVWVFGVREAIPILAISQMLTTVSRVWLHRGGLKWPVVRNFVLGAMSFSILGSMFFVSIDTKVLVRILGVMMLFLAVLAVLNFLK